MPTLQPGQVAAYAKAAGWPQNKVAWVVTVTFAESSWNTEAVHPNSNGTTDYGLAQNNSVHAPLFPDFFPPSENWKNPLINLKVAKAIHDKQGDGAWVSSDNPRRKQVEGVANQVATQVAGLNNVDNLLAYAGAKKTDSWVNTFLNWGSGIIPGTGGIAPDFVDNDGDGYPDSAGKAVIEAVQGGLFAGLGPALWIGGGSILVILGVVLLAKDMSPLGQVAKMVGK